VVQDVKERIASRTYTKKKRFLNVCLGGGLPGLLPSLFQFLVMLMLFLCVVCICIILLNTTMWVYD